MRNSSADAALSAFVEDREKLISVACRIVESRAVAEEIVQESWLRWHDKDYPASQAKPIFQRIVYNIAYDLLRRQRLERNVLALEYLVSETAPDSEQIVVARQDLRRAVAALMRLPKRTVRALRLRSNEGLSYTQIGLRMQISRSRAYELVEDALVEISLAIDAPR
ncbi:MAG: RNA polymerase sigma factor [Pseudomonadota bacterium]